jgi:hypothetical protein
MYEQMIGKKVTKLRDGKNPKPFKSRLIVNTVKGIINHPILNRPAFTFEEDDSFVECRRCYAQSDEGDSDRWCQ